MEPQPNPSHPVQVKARPTMIHPQHLPLLQHLRLQQPRRPFLRRRHHHSTHSSSRHHSHSRHRRHQIKLQECSRPGCPFNILQLPVFPHLPGLSNRQHGRVHRNRNHHHQHRQNQKWHWFLMRHLCICNIMYSRLHQPVDVLICVCCFEWVHAGCNNRSHKFFDRRYSRF